MTAMEQSGVESSRSSTSCRRTPRLPKVLVDSRMFAAPNCHKRELALARWECRPRSLYDPACGADRSASNSNSNAHCIRSLASKVTKKRINSCRTPVQSNNSKPRQFGGTALGNTKWPSDRYFGRSPRPAARKRRVCVLPSVRSSWARPSFVHLPSSSLYKGRSLLRPHVTKCG
jgi:hypothetical protein